MYYNKNSTVYLNGKWIKASNASTSLYDQTLHYGNGVFEGIRAYNTEDGTQIFKAKEHYDRLLYSAKKMHINVKYNSQQLVDITYDLLQKNKLTNAYIRPLISLGPNMSLQPVNEVNLFICAWKWERYLGDQLLRVQTSSYTRPDPRSCHVEAKTVGHYTNSILATTEAKQNGFDEALLLDVNGYVAEGPGANFFFEKNNSLYTCPLGNILPGITRATVLEMAKILDINVVEKHFTKEEVYNANAAFFCGTAAEIAGLASLDNIPFKSKWKNSLSYELSQMYQRNVLKRTYQFFELV